MSDEIALKDASTQNIRQVAGTSYNNVDGSNNKKERQGKKPKKQKKKNQKIKKFKKNIKINKAYI